jgi:nicotinate-nucleotide pyrophosphorylase (carboxylating)
MVDDVGLYENQLNTLIDLALEEDTGGGDITSESLIPAGLQAKTTLLAKAEGVLAGVDLVKLVFIKVDSNLKFKILLKDGVKLHPGDIIATVTGNARSILKAERLALNFVQRLSGIATHTNQFVEMIKDLPVDILDTRKTTPGMRLLEKYAVSMGGGRNHRFNLSDGILIKDNHIASLRAHGMTLQEIIGQAKVSAPKGIRVEVEVTNLKEVREAVAAGADIIMFDNMSPALMRRAVKLVPSGIYMEASGNITLKTVRAVAESGVNFISVGALTHSSKALDMSLEFQPIIKKKK